MSIYRREIDAQCCNQWMKGIRTINGQYPDDNRDFDVNAGRGIQITPATGGITIENLIYSNLNAGDNIEITTNDDDIEIALVSDPVINGDIQINGDIIQNGSAYETHAEQVFTTKDYVIMRDGAISALSAGDYSGFQVKKYDGTNDGRLVIDKDGVARVGDVGDEQPLLTRRESVDLSNGGILRWDGVNQRAYTDVDKLTRVFNDIVQVSSVPWTSDVTYADYGYKCDIDMSTYFADLLTLNLGTVVPMVAFSPVNSDNSLFAPVCEYGGSYTLTIYSSAIPTDVVTVMYVTLIAEVIS